MNKVKFTPHLVNAAINAPKRLLPFGVFHLTMNRTKSEPKLCSDGIIRPIPAKRTIEEYNEIFWSRVDKSGPGGCWIWKGKSRDNCSGSVYGIFWNGKKDIKAHRYAYELVVGKIPSGMLACHKCDNPICCNPDHIFLGTYLDNNRDKNRKGRHPKGTKTVQAKLNDDAVRLIRKTCRNYNDTVRLGEKFNVTSWCIWMAWHRKSWKHVI